MYSYVPLWVVANEYVRKATLAKTRNRYKSHFPASFLSFFSISSPTFCENSDTSNTCLFCLPLKRQLVWPVSCAVLCFPPKYLNLRALVTLLSFPVLTFISKSSSGSTCVFFLCVAGGRGNARWSRPWELRTRLSVQKVMVLVDMWNDDIFCKKMSKSDPVERFERASSTKSPWDFHYEA